MYNSATRSLTCSRIRLPSSFLVSESSSTSTDSLLDDPSRWVPLTVRADSQLKYYGGRNIFASLYESPADRKRSALRNLFDSLPEARFILLGDSAEQDLELYVECAKAYPGRAAAIAIRDVTSDRADDLVRVLQGGTFVEEPDSDVSRARSTGSSARSRPILVRNASSASLLSDDEMRSLTSAQQKLLERATTWRQRMEMARRETSPETVIMFYKEPSDIEEQLRGLVDEAREV